jgi:NAD(P)-dependent dehydrogenase (short-subunit alcohol dehydrogenase family)
MTTTVDFGGRAVVITGGTRGLGKALGREFARAGASVWLTHRWGNTDESELQTEFVSEGLPAPVVIEADVSDPNATRALMRAIARADTPLFAVISNVAFAGLVSGIDDLTRTSLELSLRYSTWPALDYVQTAKTVLGFYPRYVLATSTDGVDVCHPGYDMAGIAKAALETLCRYLALRLRSDGVRVNVVRCGALDTASSRASFGSELFESGDLRREGLILDPRTVARACVALCSGLMDSVTGQVINVDEGAALISPVVFFTGRGWPGALGPSESDPVP